MAVIYEDVNPTLIPNTTMRKGTVNGVHRNYYIIPCDGYVLRDKANDEILYDDDFNEIGARFWYTSGGASCPANYDFTPLQVTDENGVTHTAYGVQREFYAILTSELDNKQIY